MGFRFRKSISIGKSVRVNLGKKGVTSVTFGKRGTPHVTVGKNGTRAGASIPGTGISYETRLDNTRKANKPAENPARQRRTAMSNEDSDIASEPSTRIIDTTVSPQATLPAPTGLPVTMPPPGDGDDGKGGKGSDPRNVKKKNGWRKILRIIAWVVAFLFTFLLGIGAGGASTANTAGDPTTTTQYKDLQQQLVNQQEKADDVQRQLEDLNKKVGDLDALQKRLDKQKTKQEQTKQELDKQKTEQEQTQKQLDEQKAKQEQTQQQLDEKQQEQDQKQSELDEREKNIAQREAEKRQKEQETIQAAQQQAQEEQAKAQEQAQAEQQTTVAPQPTQQETTPAQPDGSGVLVAVCKDGTQSTSSPGARDYRGMCSHHGGIAQKLGRQ
ncbi:DUF4236 domain-containing protein [Bifidobacterium sp. SO1]|uniref:DUF4236 domain-containing protein n=1 Tax=Bifidobacterium sp. SO1 TaxID=2809029 RepID=UPI001BDC2AD1|nr:DUF4236 domain-containing protein [Bifidobacterium sp. SO1]MBT1162701.1 DUF4236 domain-containing protein [Bifidobacterium sp. SO1]